MSERLSTAEHHRSNNTEIEKAAAERLKNIERSVEQHKRGNQVEKARELLQKAEKAQAKHETTPKHESSVKRPILTREVNYRQTMVSVQHRLKPASRTFSRVIHSPAIEATSEVLGKTVLRPSVTLGATSCAVLVGGALYLYARANGFSLSGSEIWISLLLGGLIGLIIEGIVKSFRRIRGRL